ncbi:MAG TPA: hypothetical protein DDY98_07170 [Ruminococcaceae bacterium]|nr:hypothetical protein [Oscillospiraceae bacterium]
MKEYIELGLIALLPAAFAWLFTFFIRKGRIKKPDGIAVQLIIGVVFGLIAVMGTEFGIPMNGAQVNCRDAAVLTAGLFFGPPTGIIAGLIGGIERWFAVFWGVGSFTRVACSVSTVIAGFFAALLRKFMFENKKPGTLISLAAGLVMEVFHMTMVFVTNMATPDKAITVVRSCSSIMIFSNGLAVMFSALVVFLASGNSFSFKKHKARVSQTIQRGLLVTVIFAFVTTTTFVLFFQTTMSNSQTNSLLDLAIDETANDINDTSDENLLRVAQEVKKAIKTRDIRSVADEYEVTEINVVDENGTVTDSTTKKNIGFDMASNSRSAEFVHSLKGADSYVQGFGDSPFDRTVTRKYAAVKTDTGFILVGYDKSSLQKEIDRHIVGITKNRHVGQSGYVLILDDSFNVISAPKDFALKNFARTDERIEFPDPGVTFEISVSDTLCFGRYEQTEGYYIFSLYPEAEAVQNKYVALYTNTYLQVIVYAILFILIYTLIKKVVVNQIKKINQSLARITDGDLEEVVNVRTNAEFESLSDDINSTVDTLKKYIAEASARIDKELEFAKNIQKSALPSNFSTVNNRSDVEIFASMNPAKEVGGDFYDFYFTDKNKLHFLIADVSGKGIPAAMFMMRAKTELKSLTEAALPIHEVFTQGNEDLCEGNDAGMFVTAWQGSIDLNTGLVQFANAGHNPPIVKRNGEFQYLTGRPGFVLAGMDGVRYKPQEFQLEPGDIVYLYTDGVTEATNSKEELYGEERLLTLLQNNQFENVQELCTAVKADVDAFVGDAPQFDDITMVALRYIGKQES